MKWKAIAADPQFRALLQARRRFIVPAVVFFIAYYFALPILVGFFPEAMERKVMGQINIAYLFALSQFFMAWTVMWLYIRKAREFDAMAARLLKAHEADDQRPQTAGR